MRSSHHPWAVIAVLCSSGCNCGKKSLLADIGVPQLPAQLNFGNVGLGQTVQLPLLLGNSGSGPLDIEKQSISGPPFTQVSQFNVASLQSEGSAHATIAFSPTQAGAASGTFTLVSDGNPATVTVALVGVGLALDVSVSPPSVNFGDVLVGASPSPTQTVTLQNTTALPAYITLGTSGLARQYALTDAQGNAVADTPVELAPNAPYVLTVTFTPDAVAVFNSFFTYTVCQDATAASCLAAQSVTVSGQGVNAQLTMTPSPIVFSGIPDGTSSSQTVTISNAGAIAATVRCIYLKSLGPAACGTSSSVFTLGMPSVALPATLAPGDSLTLSVTYQSAKNDEPWDPSGNASDVLAVTYLPQGVTTPATVTDDIQASPSPAQCQLALAPTSLSFVFTGAGVPVSESLTLTNSGDSMCQISGIAIDPSSDPGFALGSGQPVTLSFGPGSATIQITFDLGTNGPPPVRHGALDFATSDPLLGNVQVPLLASGAFTYAGNGAWPRLQHDNLQSGRTDSDASSLQGVVAWTVSVGAPTKDPDGNKKDYLNSPVVAADGTVYQLGLSGTLYAVSPDGGVQWSTPLGEAVNDPHPGTPIVTADGNIFVAYGDTVQSSEQFGLYQVNSAGAVVLSVPPNPCGDGFDLPPSLTNAGLLLGADEAGSATMACPPNEIVFGPPQTFAYEILRTGTFNVAAKGVLSLNKYGGGEQLSVVVGPDDTTYWCQSGLCDAFSPPASGFAELPGWPLRPGNTTSPQSDLALDENVTGNLMILMGGAATLAAPQQLISVVPSSASVAWTFPLPAPLAGQAKPNLDIVGDATVGNSGPVIGADGTVYVGNFDGLHAIVGATGVEKAGFPFLTGNSDVLTAPAISGDGTIFFGTAGGTFYAVNPDGTKRFQVSAGGRIAGSPAIGPSGAVYFIADDGYLYAVH